MNEFFIYFLFTRKLKSVGKDKKNEEENLKMKKMFQC
jgi:hypothetical protein